MTSLWIRLWRVLAGLYLTAYLFWFGLQRFGIADYWTRAVAPFVPQPWLGLLWGFDLTVTIVGAVLCTYFGWARYRSSDLEILTLADAIGAFGLLIWIFKYWPSANRLVPHWPLDLVATVLGMIILGREALRQRRRLREWESEL
jgi:hypothetical protein